MKFVVDVTLTDEAKNLAPEDVADRIHDFLCSEEILTIVGSWDSVEPVDES